MTGVPTTNYGFSKIDFNTRPWDSDEHANWDLLDAILYTVAQVPNIAGVWRNSTQYQVGQNVLDPNTLVFYQCLVANVSAAAGTFAADRTANPANWTLTNSGQGSVRYDMGQALSNAQILQAQNNLALLTTFLRFDAPQTLTYNNMLQVLNTLGIDGLETGIASAATTDISNVNTQAVAINGTTTITSFGTRPNKYKLIRFTGSLRLVNSSALNIPGGSTIVTQPGDTCVAFSDSATPTANWTIRGYIRADGSPLNIPSDTAETLKSVLIQLSKLRATSLGMFNYLADDFNDSSGFDTANAVNASVQGGVVYNQSIDANCTALLHFDGTNGATSTTDDKGHAVSLTNAVLSTARSKFGTASLAPSANGYALIAGSTDFLLFQGDYTVEAWVYFTSTASGQYIVQIGNTSSDRWIVYTLPSNVIGVYSGSGVANVITGSTTVTANTWHHVAVARSGTTTTLYLDGVSQGTTTSTAFPSTGTPTVAIGGDQISGGTTAFAGNIDEVRISKGLARYTAPFTPPTTAFQAGSSGNLTLPSISATGVTVAPTKVSMYALVKSVAGTLTMNTNMIFSASRDGGTTYTQFTLANVGSYGGYTIYEQNYLDISAQPSGTSPKYKVITNDVALGVAIDAVLFQWG
jgi:hypothetical protein